MEVFETAIEAMRFLKNKLKTLEENDRNKIYFTYDAYREEFIVTFGENAGPEIAHYIEKMFYKDPDDAEYHAKKYTVYGYALTAQTVEYPYIFLGSRASRLAGGTKFSRKKWGIGTEYSVSFHIA
ncbi:hypothetical protein WMW72_10765 [Paenibacillus filicis]|uniref:Uncharacterized protein n=1 Tax=Paenibacillus filicis TaxID=669464 RepID=A0ABU9DJY0_9BACL